MFDQYVPQREAGEKIAWRVVTVKWLGLFPALLVIAYTTKFLGIKPLALKLFVETLIVVPLMHYVISPWMKGVFAGWIRGDQ